MPVRKFRSVEEMPPVFWEPGDPQAMELLAELMALALSVLPPYPRGVFSYTGMDDPRRPTLNPAHRTRRAKGEPQKPPGGPRSATGG